MARVRLRHWQGAKAASNSYSLDLRPARLPPTLPTWRGEVGERAVRTRRELLGARRRSGLISSFGPRVTKHNSRT